MRIINHTVSNENTIKNILKNELHMSSGFIKRLKYDGEIILNGSEVKNSQIGHTDDHLIIICPKSEPSNMEAVEEDFEILYEDEDVLCVNKPPKMPTHPSQNHHNDTLANRVYHYLKKSDNELHIVTRLDNYTSGVVLIAKNSYSASIMCTKEYNLSIDKEYIGICRGIFTNKTGIIESPIGRCNDSIIKRCVSVYGKYAKTGYNVIQETKNCSVVNFKLYTGRTHQIRVHCQSINHPLLNDFLYDSDTRDDRIFHLHCHRITFTHPLSQNKKTVAAYLPKQFFEDVT